MDAPLAQLVEHLTLNQGVQGSSPWRRSESTVFADDVIAAGTVFFNTQQLLPKNKEISSKRLT